MNYIDSHCHLGDNYFYNKIDNFITEWQDLGIKKIGSMATNLKTAKRNIYLQKKYPQLIVPGIGRHPWGAYKTTEEELNQFELLIEQTKDDLVIGEIGLDYYFIKEKEKQEKQLPVFISFLEMANKHKRPIMLHLTRAEKEIYEILTTIKMKRNVCCHWFSGSEKILKKLSDLGCYFTINPAFLRSKNHRKVLEIININHLLTESDGPVKFQNEIGSPALMCFLYEKIAEIKNLSLIDLTAIISSNFTCYLRNDSCQ
ncbi:MAG: TatD family hydrolase [Candidatus Heimdallarchaeota archaeon]|nr:TatD family hydrolase [Candidatus Heimdallarchaeota archaeon]